MRSYPVIDLTGHRFGRLIVLERAPNSTSAKPKVMWKCQCDCGNQKVTANKTLKSGSCRSCGCLKLESDLRHQGKGSHRWSGCGDIPGMHWNSVKHNAHTRGISFDITIQDAWAQFQKQKGGCTYTGLPLVFGNSRAVETTASLDRINSDQGYTPSNIQWVHKTIQLMKNILGDQEFIHWCHAVAKFIPIHVFPTE